MKKINSIHLLLLYPVVFLIPIFSFAQQNDTSEVNRDELKNIKILPIPTFGYEPETKTHIGVVSLFTLNFYHDSLTRTSNAKIEFNYTFRNQIILESEWDYFFREEKWFTNGIIHISRYPDFYYGVGSDTKSGGEVLFNSNRLIIDVNTYKNIGNKKFIGLGIRYFSYQNVTTEVSNPYPELISSNVFGIKGAFFQDTRNSLLNATSGNYFFLETDYNFSNLNYLRIKIDIRRYYTFKNKYIVASRLYNSFNFNTPNFYDYSILGGDKYVRGYIYGRYREKNLTTFQAELRFSVFWRIGLAAIGGVSSIYPDFSSIFDIIRPNYGLGLRFVIDKKENINLRFDYVLGSDGQNGFYISFGESF